MIATVLAPEGDKAARPGLLGIGSPRVPADLPQLPPARRWPDSENCGNCCNRHGTIPVSVFVTVGPTRTTDADSYCPPCADEAVAAGLCEVAL